MGEQTLSARSLSVAYAYPMWHTVSFTLVARQHIRWLRELGLARVVEVDELVLPGFEPAHRYALVMHPAFFLTHRVLQTRVSLFQGFKEEYWEWWKSKFEQLIGIDVCDSDAYTELAVSLANHLDKLIVPSRLCVDVARKSWIKAKVYRVQHGVEPEWYALPSYWDIRPASRINPSLLEAYLYKLRGGKRYLLFWLWHSPDRKGFPELVEFYKKLRRERDDALLLMWTPFPNTEWFQAVMQLGAVNVYGWTKRSETMAIFDMADVTLNFSRGGGFELTCLESLARGVPCVASDWGSWTDYVPPYLRVKRGRRVRPLPGNALHGGWGYAVDVDSAVDRVCDILDNLDDYKARVLEWREKVLKPEYRWDVVAEKLAEVVGD